MRLHEATTTFIDAVQRYSGGQLKHAGDCALLVEAADEHALADLSFTAKFLHKTFGVMNRIGAGGEGYDRLSEEFESNTVKAQSLLRSIVDRMDADDRTRLTDTYLAMTAPSFQAMMELVHDLSWVKNYTIDMKAKA
jgi:hypothetical protein